MSPKSELMLLGSRQNLKKCTTNSLEVLGENIEKSEVIRYLSGYLHSTLTFKQHIKTKCKSTMLNLLKIISIRKCMDKENCDTTYSINMPMSHLILCRWSPNWTARLQYKAYAENSKTWQQMWNSILRNTTVTQMPLKHCIGYISDNK